jgi:putative ABC transport system permease protein
MGIGKQLLIAGSRTVVQLFAIGLILDKVFAINQPLLVFLVLIVMALLAGWTISHRTKRTFPGILLTSILSITFPSFLMTSYAVFVVVHPPNWADPRYLIPLMGMVLGNSLTAISLAMDRFTNAMVENRSQIELILCFGFDRKKATEAPLRDAIRTGMTPMVNAMLIVGLISLPGMMTGQILGGSSPGMAVRYQILVMFLLAGSTALGSALSVLLLRRKLLDPRDRLRASIRERN